MMSIKSKLYKWCGGTNKRYLLPHRWGVETVLMWSYWNIEQGKHIVWSATRSGKGKIWEKLVEQLHMGGVGWTTGAILLRCLHLILRHNFLNLSYPSSPIQTIGWGFSLAPSKALRKHVGGPPWALHALESTWLLSCELGRCGFEASTSWALDWSWSVITHR